MKTRLSGRGQGQRGHHRPRQHPLHRRRGAARRVELLVLRVVLAVGGVLRVLPEVPVVDGDVTAPVLGVHEEHPGRRDDHMVEVDLGDAGFEQPVVQHHRISAEALERRGGQPFPLGPLSPVSGLPFQPVGLVPRRGSTHPQLVGLALSRVLLHWWPSLGSDARRALHTAERSGARIVRSADRPTNRHHWCRAGRSPHWYAWPVRPPPTWVCWCLFDGRPGAGKNVVHPMDRAIRKNRCGGGVENRTSRSR